MIIVIHPKCRALACYKVSIFIECILLAHATKIKSKKIVDGEIFSKVYSVL